MRARGSSRRRAPWFRLVVSIVAVFAAPVCAGAQPRSGQVFARVVPNAATLPSRSASIGEANRGRLRGAVELSPRASLVVRASRRGAATWGTAELVGLIASAADAVGAQYRGARLVVGDLSRRSGGRIFPHHSHRSGRDADIGFYLTDGSGRAMEPPHFVNIRRDGCGELREQRYCFDAARNFDLIASLLGDATARVQYVLIAPDIRARLLQEGQRRHAPAELLERIRLATEPHSGSHSHRSHFHVRIYCPVDDRPECLDEPPFHPWYEGTPPPRPHVAATHRARARRALARRRAVARRRQERDRRQRV